VKGYKTEQRPIRVDYMALYFFFYYSCTDIISFRKKGIFNQTVHPVLLNNN
jgi:hypothetical protein